MILLDYSAVAIANITMGLKMEKEQLTEAYALHMILNSIRASNMKFKSEYAPMIICCDGVHNWRKKEFPHYKYKRRKDREDSSSIDWDMIYQCLDYTKDAITDGFPYPVLEHDEAEADDIIGVLAKYATEKRIPTVIVSNDKDFVQRHSGSVKQWRPCESAFIRNEDPQKFLKELIIRGDSDDGVPNIKTIDEHFTLAVKPKQKSIYQKELDIWLYDDNNSFLEDDEFLKKNFERNKKLIDLNNTPDHIKDYVISTYEAGFKPANKSQMVKFFMKHRLRMLHEKINDFI